MNEATMADLLVKVEEAVRCVSMDALACGLKAARHWGEPGGGDSFAEAMKEASAMSRAATDVVFEAIEEANNKPE